VKKVSRVLVVHVDLLDGLENAENQENVAFADQEENVETEEKLVELDHVEQWENAVLRDINQNA